MRMFENYLIEIEIKGNNYSRKFKTFIWKFDIQIEVEYQRIYLFVEVGILKNEF